MHEYSLVQAMFDQIGDIMRGQHARSVRRVRVRIGDGAGVEPALFRTAYELYRENTFCAEAPLEIQAIASSDELVLDQIELEVL